MNAAADDDDATCPFCGADDASCEHVFASVDDAADPSTLAPEWSEIDEILRSLDRDTLDGGAFLDERSRRNDAWWLTSRGRGVGASERLSDLSIGAARFELLVRPRRDVDGVVLYAADAAAAATRVSGALGRIKRELSTIARRFGLAD